MTLSQSDLRTHTTASCSASYPAEDSLLLNGAPQELTSARPQACLKELRALRKAMEDADRSLAKLSALPLLIVSENNFPTAAGLASSAAGFAALVRAIADLYQLRQTPTELSLIARQGSGSACRSLMGGYVAWDMGAAADGSDSKARVVAHREHWPEMRALILVVSAEKKGVSSTAGMQATVKTSSLFRMRAKEVVPRAMQDMEQAIANRDFELFAGVTMRDSNSFHATCLDTQPPIFYLNEVSHAAIRAVESLNEKAGRKLAAYTFDAGPNAVVYHLEDDSATVAGAFKAVLGETEGWSEGWVADVKAADERVFDAKIAHKLKAGISRVIATSVGQGPVSVDEHLVDEKGAVLR